MLSNDLNRGAFYCRARCKSVAIKDGVSMLPVLENHAIRLALKESRPSVVFSPDGKVRELACRGETQSHDLDRLASFLWPYVCAWRSW